MCISGLTATEIQWNIASLKYKSYYIIPLLRILQWLLFDLGIESLTCPPKPNIWPTSPTSPILLLAVLHSTHSLKQINLTAAFGPLLLLFQFFKWLESFSSSRSQPKCHLFRDAFHLPPSLYFIHLFYFYYNIAIWKYHIYLLIRSLPHP